MAENEGYSRLDRVKERRERLAGAADELERATTRAAGDAGAWSAAVQVALGQVGTALDAHVREVEAPDGLFADIVGTSPRLIHAVGELRDDHATMGDQVHGLETLLAADPVSVSATRDAALTLLSAISRHRQKGADLVWERYTVDIGGSD